MRCVFVYARAHTAFLPWTEHTVPPALQYWRPSQSWWLSPACIHKSSLTTHQWTGFKSLKRARALTTLLLAVSSKDCMTFNLCLNLICSMTSARRLPNFYMKRKRKACTKRRKEKANRTRKENYWLRHLHRRIKHVEVKEGFVPPPKPHRTS